MFQVSDGEMALAAAAGAKIRQTASAAQQIVDRKNRELTAAYARIAKLERENAQLIAERGQRNQQKIAAYLSRH